MVSHFCLSIFKFFLPYDPVPRHTVCVFCPRLKSQIFPVFFWRKTKLFYQYISLRFRYASRAKSIKNKAKINEDPKDALMKQYQKEIEDLRRLLEEGSGDSDENDEEEEDEGDGEEDDAIEAAVAPPGAVSRERAADAADGGGEKADVTKEKAVKKTKEKTVKVGKKEKKEKAGKPNKSPGELLEMKSRIEEEKKRLLEEKDMAEEERKVLERTLRQNEEVRLKK